MRVFSWTTPTAVKLSDTHERRRRNPNRITELFALRNCNVIKNRLHQRHSEESEIKPNGRKEGRKAQKLSHHIRTVRALRSFSLSKWSSRTTGPARTRPGGGEGDALARWSPFGASTVPRRQRPSRGKAACTQIDTKKRGRH